jgi:RNA recognition motif-containing protein
LQLLGYISVFIFKKNSIFLDLKISKKNKKMEDMSENYAPDANVDDLNNNQNYENEDYSNGNGGGEQQAGADDDGQTKNGNIMEPEQFRKVFIGGLSYKTDDETLKTYFTKYGDLVDYVVMKDPNTQRSRGFGFVTYSDSYMVDELMKNRPHIIDGRQVEPKRATPREDSGKAEVQMTVKKIFVGGLRDALTEDDLRTYFSQYGSVLEAMVMREKLTEKSRGFGFVTFDDYDPVDKIIRKCFGIRILLRKNISIICFFFILCLVEKHHTINGINVHTQKALPKEQDRGAPMNKMQGGGGGGRGGYMGGGGGRNCKLPIDSLLPLIRFCFVGGLCDESAVSWFAIGQFLVSCVVQDFCQSVCLIDQLVLIRTVLDSEFVEKTGLFQT